MLSEARETVGVVPVVAGRASSTPDPRVFSRCGSRGANGPPAVEIIRHGTRVRLQRRRRFSRAFHNLCRVSHLTSSRLAARRQAEFDFQTLLDKLPADEPRYFVLDWSATTADDRHIDKIFFVSWVPDTCKAKTKMLYASSKQALRNALDGVQLDHQATDYDEVTPEEFNERSGV
jgi:cofilin